MNHGRIEQSGSARDVFERPRTEFVARFIGAHNVFQTPAAKVAVRADKLELADESAAGVPVQVRAIEYQGASVNVHLVPPGAQESADDDAPLLAWVALLPDQRFHAHPVQPGQRLSLRWAEADAHPLQA
jgi:putative spermidine/putrescine transport system ATP-binding protein